MAAKTDCLFVKVKAWGNLVIIFFFFRREQLGQHAWIVGSPDHLTCCWGCWRWKRSAGSRRAHSQRWHPDQSECGCSGSLIGRSPGWCWHPSPSETTRGAPHSLISSPERPWNITRQYFPVKTVCWRVFRSEKDSFFYQATAEKQPRRIIKLISEHTFKVSHKEIKLNV